MRQQTFGRAHIGRGFFFVDDEGKPGRVRVKDRHGNIHVLRASAAGDHVIPQGVIVLLVDGADGHFYAIPAPSDLVAHTDLEPGGKR